jgi:hypothetical protein
MRSVSCKIIMRSVLCPLSGVMAQLVARLLSMQKVFGSIPNYSTFFSIFCAPRHTTDDDGTWVRVPGPSPSSLLSASRLTSIF